MNVAPWIKEATKKGHAMQVVFGSPAWEAMEEAVKAGTVKRVNEDRVWGFVEYRGVQK